MKSARMSRRLAEFIRGLDEVKLVVGSRHFDQLSKPRSLPVRVGGKVENDRNPLHQQGNDVRGDWFFNDRHRSGELIGP